MTKFLIFLIVAVISFIGHDMFKNRIIDHEVFVKNSEGVITAKNFTKEYATSSFIFVGKVMVPTTTTHPAKYSLEVVYNGKSKLFDVSQYTYEKYKEGDIIAVKVYNVDQFRRDVQFGSFENFKIEG